MMHRSIVVLGIVTLAASACSGTTNVGNTRDAGSDPGSDASAPPRTDPCGNGIDDDRNGRIDDGCPCGPGETQACFSGELGARNVGMCADGTQTCTATGSTEWGDWGDSPCAGDTLPIDEVCDGQDHDCDGTRDEGCPCTAGDARACGVEFVVAPCTAGAQACSADGTWGGCEGAVGPTPDVCDGVDNDCDGTPDPGCHCTPEPERCRDGIDNDCDGAIDESACTPDWPPADGGVPDAGAPDGGVVDCSGATSGWVATSVVDAPSPRTGPAYVWTGSELIVWGGWDGALTNEGRRFDPIANRWRFMTNGGAPSARTAFAVWTGREMAVWGGRTASGATNTGALYDPATDTWRPMSLVGAPSARGPSNVLWTGREIIVWGGAVGAGVYVNDGGRYDPVTDTWRPMSTVGAPSARERAEAVWSGREMIVWGGHVSMGVVLSDGGIYDPATDSWRPLPAAGGPAEWRIAPAVAWTGREMAIWGGRNPTISLNIGYLATGFLFDPVASTWRPMGDTRVPEGRTYPGAAVGGGKLFVWGGEFNGLVHSPDNLLPTGAVYDLATDTWSATPAAGAPAGRWSGDSQKVAVWTGCSFVIWGGLTSAGITDTGGIWTP